MIKSLPMTAEQLSRLPDDGRRYELVQGQLRMMTPSGFEHGRIVANISGELRAFVMERRLGVVLAGDTGFTLQRDPDTVRAPDVAFVAKDRVPPIDEQKSFAELTPDLVVEVLSPHDRPADVEEKISDFLTAGVKLIWLFHPATKTVTEYRGSAVPRTLTADDTLIGHDVLTGFSCGIALLFE